MNTTSSTISNGFNDYIKPAIYQTGRVVKTVTTSLKKSTEYAFNKCSGLKNVVQGVKNVLNFNLPVKTKLNVLYLVRTVEHEEDEAKREAYIKLGRDLVKLTARAANNDKLTIVDVSQYNLS